MKEITLTFSWFIATLVILGLGSYRANRKEDKNEPRIADIHTAQISSEHGQKQKRKGEQHFMN